MTITNKAFVYKKVPVGWPVAGEDLTIEDIGFDDQAPPPPGGVTTKNLYAAFDPSQRGRMRNPEQKSYSAAMEPGKPVLSVSVIGKVLKSDNKDYPEGCTVMIGTWYTESYSSVPEKALKGMFGAAKVIEDKPGVPLTAYLGALGMTGMTAYGSLHELGEPKRGDAILVSGAAGAVGQTVGQIAVREGLHVIGSVGDDKKIEFITKELGFHAGFNYKKENLSEAISRLAPDGLDIYYDNVGGELLDVALLHMKDFGRIVACGGISQYNNKSPDEAYGLKNYMHVVRKRLAWRGFLVFDKNIMQHAPARDKNIAKWIADGSFKSVDHVTQGIDNAVDGFLGMLKGENLGKSFVKIQDA